MAAVTFPTIIVSDCMHTDLNVLAIASAMKQDAGPAGKDVVVAVSSAAGRTGSTASPTIVAAQIVIVVAAVRAVDATPPPELVLELPGRATRDFTN
ncbi:unnamed protein product [Urochloa humidicola]